MTVNKRTLAGIIGAVAASLLVGFTATNEGRQTEPYRDIGGVWTVCDGQTRVKMRVYTDGECDAMLAESLGSYAQHVSDVTPGFIALPDGVKAATVDFAYNVGAANYDKSTLRKLLAGKQIALACEQFLKYKYAAGRDCSDRANGCYGVWKRRIAERSMCLGND